MTSLTPNAEKLLQEILNVCQNHHGHDVEYWRVRFDNLSFEDDALLRSTFKELSDAEMINVEWTDIPVDLVLLNKGVSYFEMKAQEERREKQAKRSDRKHDIVIIVISVFLSATVEALLRFFGIGG